MRALAFSLAAAMALNAPLSALAQHRGGGGGGGGARSAAPVRASAPQARPAQSRGFDLHEDESPPRQTAPVAASRPQTAPANRPDNATHPVARTNRPALVGNLGYGGQPGNHRVVGNPHYHGGSWGWNHGETWNPAPRYWGGGFWGPWELGVAAAVLFGALYYEDQTYDSYQVEADSPGAELLADYQLTQVPCGPPDLVVIFGPDNSVICADPNDAVAAGEYQLDPADLTIVSLDQ